MLQGLNNPSVDRPRTRLYYDDLGTGHDDILRCKDCRRLVLFSDVKKHGSCSCGNRHVVEITTLSVWEWLKIRLGIIRFSHRREFLKEFNCGRR